MSAGLPAAFDVAIEEQIKGVPIAELRRRVSLLSERYRSGQRAGSSFIKDDLDALAYCAYRMPATAAAIQSVLRQIKQRLPDWTPQTLLDVGAGTGAGVWACASELPWLEHLTLIDSSPAMLSIGQRLVKSTAFPAGTSVEWQLGDVSSATALNTSQVILASYLLNELSAQVAQATVAHLWNHVEDLFIVIEPGTPRGFESIRSIRKHLIGLGATIAAPCPHTESCPMPVDDWCHFSVRLPRNRIHREAKPGELPYEDEKFSYVVASKIPVLPAKSRILRHPDYRRGMVGLTLCTTSGITLQTVTRRKDRQLYRSARDAGWGDEFPSDSH